nr:EOG090X03T7 [Triops cancriformis]
MARLHCKSCLSLSSAIKFVLFWYTWVQCSTPTYCLHLKGTFQTTEFFEVLTKFGFQKTNLKNRQESQGYIYGNITTSKNFTHPITFAVLDRGYFLEYYGNSTVIDRQKACSSMFHKVSTVAFDGACFDDGQEDFLRKVPCQVGKICPDEDRPESVVRGYQFTYAIQDLNQARFWYISFVACYRDRSTNCTWKPILENYEVNYDVWLVNGNPYAKNQNPLEYQFSFDNQDTVEVYIVFFIAYLFLVPFQVYAISRQKHTIPWLFTFSVILMALGAFLNMVDSLKFAFDGEGVATVAIVGDILDILAQTLFMLLLLVLAKGWAITKNELTWKPVVFSVWALYGVVHVILYVWDRTEVDVIEDIDVYQTWPGWLILILRTLIMAWFLLCLRNTMEYEHNRNKLDFFLHFGASSLVWFIYLPIVALVALQVSALWRKKLLLGITSSVNFLASAVMAHLLWPTRAQQYFLLAHEADITEELEEFNEAPHVLNSDTTNVPALMPRRIGPPSVYQLLNDGVV